MDSERGIYDLGLKGSRAQGFESYCTIDPETLESTLHK